MYKIQSPISNNQAMPRDKLWPRKSTQNQKDNFVMSANAVSLRVDCHKAYTTCRNKQAEKSGNPAASRLYKQRKLICKSRS
jgi:hypothetical protein